MISMTIEREGRDPLTSFQWTRAAVRWADEVGPLGRAAIKAKAPVGKGPGGGRLRDSIRYVRRSNIGSGVTITFNAHTPYAGFVVKGTPPHIIEARAAKSLHWVGPNGDVFRKRVRHPGTKPNPFPRRALTPLIPVIQAKYRDAIINEFRRG